MCTTQEPLLLSLHYCSYSSLKFDNGVWACNGGKQLVWVNFLYVSDSWGGGDVCFLLKTALVRVFFFFYFFTFSFINLYSRYLQHFICKDSFRKDLIETQMAYMDYS